MEWNGQRTLDGARARGEVRGGGGGRGLLAVLLVEEGVVERGALELALVGEAAPVVLAGAGLARHVVGAGAGLGAVLDHGAGVCSTGGSCHVGGWVWVVVVGSERRVRVLRLI